MAVQTGPLILKAKKKDRPNLRDIANFVVPYVHHKWYYLGLQLLDTADEIFLLTLKTRYQDSSDRCTEVFTHWLDVKKKPTWGDILEGLIAKSVNLQSVADNIKKMLVKSNPGPVRRCVHKVHKRLFKKKQSSLPPIAESHLPSSSDTEAERGQAINFQEEDSDSNKDTDSNEDTDSVKDTDSESDCFSSSHPGPTREFHRSVSFQGIDLERKRHYAKFVSDSDNRNRQSRRRHSSVPDELDKMKKTHQQTHQYTSTESLDPFIAKYIEILEKLNKKNDEIEELKADIEKLTSELNKLLEEKKAISEKLTAKVNKISDEKSALLKQVEEADEELCKTKMAQEKEIDKIQDENVRQENEIKNLREENTVLVEQREKLTMQLEQTRITLEKEISDLKSEEEKKKSAAIKKATEFQNLMKENEKLQQNYQATKKHNHIVLRENSKMQSELTNTCDEVTQLKEDFETLKGVCFQNLQEFIHEFVQKNTLLKQRVEEIVFLKNKADQDRDAVMCEYADIAQKYNALSLENDRLKRNSINICYNCKRFPSSP